jgi:hypothetical protein
VPTSLMMLQADDTLPTFEHEPAAEEPPEVEPLTADDSVPF